MRIQELQGPGDEAVVVERWRQRLAAALEGMSRMLAQMAVRLRGRRRSVVPALEFYAEAGAPEGALYVDGQRVGSLPGVTRL